MSSEAFQDWPAGLQWLGGTVPALRERVVVAAFWDVDDPGAVEVAQVLAWLGLRFAGRPFVAAAIHHARGGVAEDASRVRRTAARLGFGVPVACDSAAAAFAAWGSGRLPSLVLLDAAGAVRFRGAGVPDRARLTAAIDALVAEAYGEPGEPDLAAAPAPEVPAGGVRLDAPAALALDTADGTLWIADAGRRPRLLGVDAASGALRHTVGAGRPGSADGDPALASFAAPAGLCCEAGVVFVADLGNHLVRSVDLDHYGVTTLLGVGRAVIDVHGGRAGLMQGIAGPLGVAALDADRLVVAMSGLHQLWTVATADGYAESFVGSGVAGWSDGVRHDVACHRPTGVAVRDDLIAFVDGASGAVRCAELQGEMVYTVLDPGTAGGPVAPRAVAWLGDDLLVADPPTGRVLRVRTADHTVTVLADRRAGLDEPVALAVAAPERIFVADLGHAAVLVLDATSGSVTTLEPSHRHPAAAAPPADAVQSVPAGGTLTLCFPMPLPPGERLHPETAGHAWLFATDGDAPLHIRELPVEREGEWGTLRDLPVAAEGCGTVEVVVRYGTCADLDAVVHVQEIRGRVRLEAVAAGGVGVLDLQLA